MLVVCRSEDRPTTSVVEEQSCGKAVRSSLGTDRLRGYREAVSFKIHYVSLPVLAAVFTLCPPYAAHSVARTPDVDRQNKRPFRSSRGVAMPSERC